ncbi:hypothetical protein C0Q70_19814 [Pomacea canaliculata]|uniref:Uncharacterized protein n=1 Tax=Pomacea canaliculata TaxID=400727 RepID=A0A2T7NDT2_POMCA|nr:hypothetical protein C0Q70_19814 [Pomacea canaliculata]
MTIPILLLLLLGSFGVYCVADDSDNGLFEINIRMPNATSQRKDDLVCHAYKLPSTESYILKFIPHASMHVAHHMMVYGCTTPGDNQRTIGYIRRYTANDDTRQPQQAGYYVLGNYGSIPPQMPAFKMESACEFNLNYTIYPVGYRTHGHNIAVVNSGYRIRDGEWVELGRMSPQRPQTFYDIKTPGLDIRDGDILTSRCTFNSMRRTKPTQIGPTNDDEMCNFYILYSTYEQKDLTTATCFRNGNTFLWTEYFTQTPPDASSLRGSLVAKRSAASLTWIPDETHNDWLSEVWYNEDKIMFVKLLLEKNSSLGLADVQTILSRIETSSKRLTQT